MTTLSFLALLSVAQLCSAARLRPRNQTRDQTEMCCCVHSYAKSDCGSDAYFYPCIAFHKTHPKCCKKAAVCEQAITTTITTTTTRTTTTLIPDPSCKECLVQKDSKWCVCESDPSKSYCQKQGTSCGWWSCWFNKVKDAGSCPMQSAMLQASGQGEGEGPQTEIIPPADPKLCTDGLDLEKVREPTPDLGFFDDINKDPNKDASILSRDYTIIIDQSGSMSSTETTYVPEAVAQKMGDGYRAGTQRMSLWNQAGIAAAYLSDAAVQVDPDGITLMFFDSQLTTYENVKSDKDVLSLFKARSPRGSTSLTPALAEALQPDTMGRAETVLVITDGAPNSRPGVEQEIVKASRQLCRDEDLTITFLQVGSASSATQFLQYLDDELEKKHGIYDIVDTMTQKQMEGKSFLEIIELSIRD